MPSFYSLFMNQSHSFDPTATTSYTCIVVFTCGNTPQNYLNGSSSVWHPNVDGRMRGQAGALLYEHGFSRRLLLSGGQLHTDQPSLAVVMRDYLTQRYSVPADVMLLEDRAMDTTENAEFSVALLREQGLDTALLVTNEYHLSRSACSFKRHATRAGIRVEPVAAEDVLKEYTNKAVDLYRSHPSTHAKKRREKILHGLFHLPGGEAFTRWQAHKHYGH